MNTKRLLDLGLSAAVVFTFVAIGMATLHNLGGEYDPDLAIQMLSAIGLIWYVYFIMYGTLRRSPPQVTLTLGKGGDRALDTIITNRSSDRIVTTRMIVEPYRNKELLELYPIFRGLNKVILQPGSDDRRVFSIDSLSPKEGSMFGTDVEAGEPEEMFVRATVCWTDDQGFSGQVGPLHWKVNLRDLKPKELRVHEQINKHFGHLPPLRCSQREVGIREQLRQLIQRP